MLHLIESEMENRGILTRSRVTEASTYCAVLQSDLHGVCAALVSLGKQCEAVGVWLAQDCDYGDARPAHSLVLAEVERAHSMIVAIPFRAKRLRVERSGGVEILIVEQRGERFVARQRRAATVDWTSAFLEQAESPKPSKKRSRTKTRRLHALEGQPVDAVYTWVDSTDPDWVTANKEWADRDDARLDSTNNDERYLDRDELKYSLRSLWLYAPFFRNVYIVTAGHCPGWLNVSHHNIHVIPHRAIFPKTEDLPTFNSHAIEACLHRIPGLADHFVYFNDDVFLARETSLSTFFTKAGLVKSRLSVAASIPVARPDGTSTPTDWAAYNAACLVERDFGLHFDRKLKHVPMALTRSLVDEIELRYPDHFAATRSARFRSRSDLAVPTMLAHFYGIATRKAVEWEHAPGEYIYADTGRFDFESKLASVADNHATFICLNATRHTDIPLEQQTLLLRDFLEGMYPIPSPFEMHEALPST